MIGVVLKRLFFFFLCAITAAVDISAQQAVKILPLGNSITEGYTDGTLTAPQMKGYRYDLKQLLESSGFLIDFVGSQQNGSLYFNDCQHGGIGGSRDQYVARLLTDGYDERWGVQIINPPGPYLDVYNPDIILLHIGTNDITHESESELYDNEKISSIFNLIDQYEARAGKEVIVFMALIINRKDCVTGCYTTSVWNNFIKNIALNRIAAGDKIVIVDMEKSAGFLYTDVDMADDLHPNATGYTKMAALWSSSILANYNTPPVISGIPDQQLEEGGSPVLISLDEYVTDLQDLDQDITWTFRQIADTNLNITINTSRQLSAAPLDNDWYGSQTVVFTATDKGLNGKYVKSCTDTVKFTVRPVNDAPLFTSTPVLTVDKGQNYIYTVSAMDVDTTDTLVFTLTQKPEWITYYPSNRLITGIPQHAGTYPVTVTVNDGHISVNQSFEVQVIGSTGLDENGPEGSISVYPNPARNNIILEIKSREGDIDFQLFNIKGIPVIRRIICQTCDTRISLNQANIAPGIYFYRIIASGRVTTGKIIIGHP